MGSLLLVEPTADQLARLGAALSGWRAVKAAELTAMIGDPATVVDAVVVGAGASSPPVLVQQVHAADPVTAVVVLTTSATDEEVRRALSYAPGVPAGLLVAEADDRALPEKVAQLVDAARAERQHRALMVAVSAQRGGQPAATAPLPRSLGALLHHVPFGVLVADLDGRLVGWNPWAGDLLGLASDAHGQRVADVFAEPEPLLAAFELARAGRLSAATPSFVLAGSRDTAFELNAAPTELENGRAAVLLLIQDVTERSRAEATRDRLAAHVGLLARVSEALAGMLDGDTALHRLAQQVVPVLGDWVTLQIYDARGNPRRVAVHHHDAARGELAESLQTTLPQALSPYAPSRRIARGEGPVLMREMTPAMLQVLAPGDQARVALTELGVGSVMAVPLPGRDSVLGSMVLVNEPCSRAFTEEDLAVATEVGRRAGVTLETIALYAQQSDLAAGLQRSLLSDPPPSEHGEIVVRYLAAAREAQVGGDWYDAFVQQCGDTVLVIGDVIGHDTRAAAAMGQVRALLRGIGYTTGAGPSEMLRRLDAAMDGLDVHTTATAVVAQLEQVPEAPGVRRLRWSNAGHPPPILVSPTGAAQVLRGEESDLLLGVISDAPRQERELLLQPGTTLLLYTDGLVERRGQGIDEGVAALVSTVDTLAHLPPRQLCDRVLQQMLPPELDDDVALLAVRLA